MSAGTRSKIVALAVVAALAVAACSSSGGNGEQAEETPTEAETTTTVETVEEPAGPALAMGEGTAFLIDWSALTAEAFFAFMPSDDPFWFIHTEEPDGFFSLEMFTTAYGSLWTGELGTHDIDCSPGGTGICVHLVRPGTDADLREDGAVTGTVAINQLDDTGYDIVVDATFSDGTTITGLQVTG